MKKLAAVLFVTIIALSPIQAETVNNNNNNSVILEEIALGFTDLHFLEEIEMATFNTENTIMLEESFCCIEHDEESDLYIINYTKLFPEEIIIEDHHYIQELEQTDINL